MQSTQPREVPRLLIVHNDDQIATYRLQEKGKNTLMVIAGKLYCMKGKRVRCQKFEDSISMNFSLELKIRFCQEGATVFCSCSESLNYGCGFMQSTEGKKGVNTFRMVPLVTTGSIFCRSGRVLSGYGHSFELKFERLY